MYVWHRLVANGSQGHSGMYSFCAVIDTRPELFVPKKVMNWLLKTQLIHTHKALFHQTLVANDEYKQDAQLSQRDRAVACVSFGQK